MPYPSPDSRTSGTSGTRFATVVVAFLVLAAIAVTTARPANAVEAATVVAVGYDQACVVTASASGYCWGRNHYGQLGDGTTSNSSTPVAVTGSHSWTSIAAGEQSTCGITTLGAAYCWGRNNNGQLGDGTHNDSSSPVAVSGGYTWTLLSVGSEFACGIVSGGAAYCWGKGGQGQMGDGTLIGSDTPIAVSGGYTWSVVNASRNSGQHACGVTTSGAGYCWGRNLDGQLGDDSTTDRTSPTATHGGLTWAWIAAAGSSTCGVTTGGAGYCWGSNFVGQLGDGSSTDQDTPTAISGGHTWSRISPGGGVTCGVTTSSVAYCWGANGLGALGNGTNNDSSSPSAVAGGSLYTDVSSGGGGACALTTGEMTHCWGWNQYGTLGDGHNTNRNRPSGVLSLSAESDTASMTILIDPSFSLVVTGYNAGACNGATVTSTSSTGTTVSLNPSLNANAIGGQALTVVTNADEGYTIFVRSSGVLSDGMGHTIPDWSGTDAIPTTFPSAGTATFGYTTDHALSGTANRFQTDKWAGFTTSNTEVAYLAAGPVPADTTHVCLQAGISTSTTAGLYTTTVIYTAVPNF